MDEKCCISKLVYTDIRMLGLNQLKKPNIWLAPLLSSREGSCKRALAPDSLIAGIIRALAYITETRYARDINTEGVIVMIAANMKLKVKLNVEGRVERTWIRVV